MAYCSKHLVVGLEIAEWGGAPGSAASVSMTFKYQPDVSRFDKSSSSPANDFHDTLCTTLFNLSLSFQNGIQERQRHH